MLLHPATKTTPFAEDPNHKVRVSLARSYGHRSYEVLELVLYHRMANLPEPEFTHKFC
jgi:transposase